MPKKKKPARPVETDETPEDEVMDEAEETEESDSSKSAIVRKLIRAGKDKGYLSYDELNNILPEDVTSSEEIDEVMTALHSADIKVVESGDEVESIPLAVKRDQKSVKSRKYVQIDDPVKMYLKQMGQISLLNRNEELELAKRIKRFEKEYKEVVFRIKIGREKIINEIDEALASEYNLDDVLDVEPNSDVEKLKKQKAEVIKRVRLSKKTETIMGFLVKLKVTISLAERVASEILVPLEEVRRLSSRVMKLKKGKPSAELKACEKEMRKLLR
ncbi:MAG: RNA polymerase sigma factor region1.1 domain-containing protein, partial [Candidatus Omnitrophica bacterium]|nr:RNA polymerase sigma factor region1.1 domain-containing protein [Candidatus Omnitrophota bacterium]